MLQPRSFFLAILTYHLRNHSTVWWLRVQAACKRPSIKDREQVRADDKGVGPRNLWEYAVTARESSGGRPVIWRLFEVARGARALPARRHSPRPADTQFLGARN